MLGYAADHKAYQLLNLATNKIIVSRNVRFVEHKFLDDTIGKEQEELIIATSTDEDDDDQTELQLQSEPVSTDASRDDEIHADVDHEMEEEVKHAEVDEFNGAEASDDSDSADPDPDASSESEHFDVIGGHINSGRSSGGGLWKDGKFDVTEEDSALDQLASRLMTKMPELKTGKRLARSGSSNSTASAKKQCQRAGSIDPSATCSRMK